MKRILLLAILAASVTLVGQDADRARTEALAARAAERLRALHAEADRLASEARTLLGDLRKLELERQIREEEFRRVDTEANAVAAEIAVLDQEVRTIEEQEAAERPLIQALRADAARARASADRAVDERNALIPSIDERRDLNAQLGGELQAAGQSLQLRLRDIGTGTPPADSASLPLKPFKGDLPWPVAGTSGNGLDGRRSADRRRTASRSRPRKGPRSAPCTTG